MYYDVYPRTRAKVRTVFLVYFFFFSLPSCFWLKISLSRNYITQGVWVKPGGEHSEQCKGILITFQLRDKDSQRLAYRFEAVFYSTQAYWLLWIRSCSPQWLSSSLLFAIGHEGIGDMNDILNMRIDVKRGGGEILLANLIQYRILHNLLWQKARTPTRTRAHMHTRARPHGRPTRTRARTHACMHARTHIHTHTHTHTNIHTHTCAAFTQCVHHTMLITQRTHLHTAIPSHTSASTVFPRL